MGLFSSQGAGKTSKLILLHRSQKAVVYMYTRWEWREGVETVAALFSGNRWYRFWCRGEISDYRSAGCLQEHVNSLQEVRGGTGGKWPGMEREKEAFFM